MVIGAHSGHSAKACLAVSSDRPVLRQRSVHKAEEIVDYSQKMVLSLQMLKKVKLMEKSRFIIAA